MSSLREISRRFVQHSPFEDTLALVTGTGLVSLGVALYNQVGLLTGGTAGIAFLLHYKTGIAFGWLFFLVNLPFYYLAFTRIGLRFTLNTFAAVSLVSLFSGLHPTLFHVLNPSIFTPFYIALIGGLMMGVGFVVLFRHKTSLGGINILALFLQDKIGLRAGKLQMMIDIAILLASFFMLSTTLLIASILGAIALNLSIALNHRPERYQAL